MKEKLKNSILKLRSILKINGININWHDYDKRVVCGHSGKPKLGDVFTSQMQSNKIAVFEVINVRWCDDPLNMYFADVKDVGYWGECEGETNRLNAISYEDYQKLEQKLERAKEALEDYHVFFRNTTHWVPPIHRDQLKDIEEKTIEALKELK